MYEVRQKGGRQMQPRPRMPFNSGMGQQMFGGGGRPMMGTGATRNPMMRPPAGPFGGGNPMMGARMGSGQMGGSGGGILSKLLGRGTQAGGPGGLMGMTRAGGAGGGLMQSLSNPGGLTGILNNTQQVLKTAQTIGPMIQQYGPMVKNIPAMWKLYRGFKNAAKDSESNSTEAKTKTKAKAAAEESSSYESSESVNSDQQGKQKSSKKNRSQEYQKGSSIPKMYI